MSSEDHLSSNVESFSADEDDYSDDHGNLSKQRKNNTKKNKSKRSLFIDEEAIVDDDEEEDEEDLDYEEGFIQDDDDADNYAKDKKTTINYLRNDKRSGRYAEEDKVFEEEDAMNIANRYKEKYGKTKSLNKEFLKNSAKNKVPQSFLLPKPGGTQLFSIKCKLGKEVDVMMAILVRCMQAKTNNVNPKIYSSFVKSNMKGYIYVEAHEEDHVKQWTDKIPDVFKSPPQAIPYAEMTDLINMGNSTTTSINKGDFIRIKKGKYTGDLGKVLDVSLQHDAVRIKLVPRIDFEKNSNNKRNASSRDRAKQKLFNRREIEQSEALKGSVSLSRGYYIFNNETYSKDGFLEKDFSFSYISNENVNPLEEELLMFPKESKRDESDYEEDQENNNDISTTTDIEVKTKVIVIKGESKGLVGIVVNIIGNAALIKPTGINASTLKFSISQLAKHYEVGDHVKVIRGASTGKSGMVVKTESDMLILVNDADYSEINVKSNDVKDEFFSQVTRIVHQFKLHDMVRLNNNHEVGVTVYCGNDIIRVLDQNGMLKDFVPQMLSNYGENKKSGVALDKNNAPLRVDDFVKPINKRNIIGQIQYIHKSFVFYKVQENIDPLGILVSPANLLAKAFNSKRTHDKQSTVQSRRFNSKRDFLVQKQVLIRYGLYKNYYGFVKSVDQESATVIVDGPGTHAYIKKIHLTPVDRKTLEPIHNPTTNYDHSRSEGYNNNSYRNNQGNSYKRQKNNNYNKNDSYNNDGSWENKNQNETSDWGSYNNTKDDTSNWGASKDNNDDWGTSARDEDKNDWGTSKDESNQNGWNDSPKEDNTNNWETSAKENNENDWGASNNNDSQNDWGVSEKDDNLNSWENPQTPNNNSGWDSSMKEQNRNDNRTRYENKNSNESQTFKKNHKTIDLDGSMNRNNSRSSKIANTGENTFQDSDEGNHNQESPHTKNKQDNWDNPEEKTLNENNWDSPVEKKNAGFISESENQKPLNVANSKNVSTTKGDGWNEKTNENDEIEDVNEWTSTNIQHGNQKNGIETNNIIDNDEEGW